MKFKLQLELPSAAEIVAGLELGTVHPMLADLQIVERQKAQDREAAHIALAQAITRCATVAAGVQAGRESASALEAAVQERYGAALRLPHAEAAAQEATAAREAAEVSARERLRAEAVIRNRVLEAAAERVSQLLTELSDLELALEQHASRAIGRPADLPAVAWPQCIRDLNLDALSRQGRAISRAGTIAGLNAAGL